MDNSPFTPKIGIIGGAGPAAGSLLFNRIISICQKDFSCKADDDFPSIQLINVPFPDMLSNGYSKEAVKASLQQAFNFLKACGTPLFAIACNTLHGFISPEMYAGMECVNLIQESGNILRQMKCKDALILCTSTTAKLRLQKTYFSCVYPDLDTQHSVDLLIGKILRGQFGKAESVQLEEIAQPFLQPNRGVVLGCTEFSVLNEIAPINLPNIIVIDPLDATAKTLVLKALNKDLSND